MILTRSRKRKAAEQAAERAGSGSLTPGNSKSSSRNKRRAEDSRTGSDVRATKHQARESKEEKNQPGKAAAELVSRAFYEAGSVILEQLAYLYWNSLEYMRTCKHLLDLGLVAGDAFAEMFWGRPDYMSMDRAELVELGRSVGIAPPEGDSTEEWRRRYKPLALLSVKWYRVWHKPLLLESFRSGILPGEPVWLERLLADRKELCFLPDFVLRDYLNIPESIFDVMPCKEVPHPSLEDEYDRTYRMALAIHVARRWDALNGVPKEVTENWVNRTIMEYFDDEPRIRKKVLDNANVLRKKWKEAGLDLDSVLNREDFSTSKYSVTISDLFDGWAGEDPDSVVAAQAVIKYNIADERGALDHHRRVQRFIKLSNALKEAKLPVPPALDPSALDDDGTAKARATMEISWGYVVREARTLDDAVKSRKSWSKFQDRVEAVDEIAVMRMERLDQIQQEWRKHQLEDADLLSINMRGELARKYSTTAKYINGVFWGASKDLESAVKARLQMRDDRLEGEPPGIEYFDRDPRLNHVYICPCGYRSGRNKMEKHLETHHNHLEGLTYQWGPINERFRKYHRVGFPPHPWQRI